jgi:regulator of cell morphogenesis and NO signaling
MTTITIPYSHYTVGELAAEVPTSIRVFEAWKIDYCCGGMTPLPDACAAAGRSVEEFVDELTRAAAVPDGSKLDWPAETLTSMAANIVSMYHDYTREELQTVAPIADKVLSVHGQRRPELAEVVALLRDLTADMLPHMLKEEQILFPYVNQLDAGDAPTPFFGTVRNPVRMMMLEHDRVGRRDPRKAACRYRRLYAARERLFQLPRALSPPDRAGVADARAHPRREQHLLPARGASRKPGRTARGIRRRRLRNAQWLLSCTASCRAITSVSTPCSRGAWSPSIQRRTTNSGEGCCDISRSRSGCCSRSSARRPR